jgi:hypothetical protein
VQLPSILLPAGRDEQHANIVLDIRNVGTDTATDVSVEHPAIIVEPPASCTSTESGMVAYSRVILNGFPYGSVVLKGDRSSETPSLVEVQADKYSLPLGFSLGDKTLIDFADANWNTQQDPGEASAATAFTITCW